MVDIDAPAIDVAFDFRSDTPAGKDPDSASPTLRRYHQLLWSKPLPDGRSFDLDTSRRRYYLHHRSDVVGEFFLASDSVIQTFTRWEALAPITSQLTRDENEHFATVAYTIGGMMVFPLNRVGRHQTLNTARGFNRSIADRFDLTVECIRRHYRGEASPLSGTIQRFDDFFELFGNFAGYVDFFLLDDLIDTDRHVRFFMEFDDFKPPAVPKDVDTYVEYRRRSLEFTEARNARIGQLAL